MEKTYTEKVHYRIVIEGDYTVCNKWEEELDTCAEDLHDRVWEFVAENIVQYPDNYLWPFRYRKIFVAESWCISRSAQA